MYSGSSTFALSEASPKLPLCAPDKLLCCWKSCNKPPKVYYFSDYGVIYSGASNMSHIAIAVTSFIVHLVGPNPIRAPLPKLHGVFSWDVYRRPKQRGRMFCVYLITSATRDRSLLSERTGLIRPFEALPPCLRS